MRIVFDPVPDDGLMEVTHDALSLVDQLHVDALAVILTVKLPLV